MLQAIKPVYNRKSKAFDVVVHEQPDPILCHYGYLVFDNSANTLERINEGKMLQDWSKAKVDAVKAWLSGK